MNTQDNSILQDFPPTVVEVAQALADHSGERVEPIALSALAIAGATLGNACRGSWDGKTEHNAALQLALLAPDPAVPRWLEALTAPLRDQEELIEGLSNIGSPRELLLRVEALSIKYANLKGRTGMTNPVRHRLIDDATGYALAAREQTLVITESHPWRADSVLTWNTCAPLWIPSPDTLGQWIQLMSSERRLLYRALHGYPGKPLKLPEFNARCPVIIPTTHDQLSYWMNIRAKGLPFVVVPQQNETQPNTPFPVDPILNWQTVLRYLLNVRALTPSKLLFYSDEGLTALHDFAGKVEAEKEGIPRKLRSRLDPVTDVARRTGRLLHFLNSEDGLMVSEETARSAARIGSWILNNQVEILRKIRSERFPSPEVPPIERPADSEVLFEKIRRSPVPLSRRQLCRKFKTMPAARLDALLRELNEKKLLIYT